MSSDCVSLLFRDDDARHLFSWRARAYPTLERWWVLKLIDQILELTGGDMSLIFGGLYRC